MEEMMKRHQNGVRKVAHLAINLRAWEVPEDRRSRLGSFIVVLLMIWRERWDSGEDVRPEQVVHAVDMDNLAGVKFTKLKGPSNEAQPSGRWS